jgi:hypothetical protein
LQISHFSSLVTASLNHHFTSLHGSRAHCCLQPPRTNSCPQYANTRHLSLTECGPSQKRKVMMNVSHNVPYTHSRAWNIGRPIRQEGLQDFTCTLLQTANADDCKSWQRRSSQKCVIMVKVGKNIAHPIPGHEEVRVHSSSEARLT